MTTDTRFLEGAEVRAETGEDGQTVLRGYAAVFGVLSNDLGGFREIVRPRAFDRALTGADVRCLINHDATKVLGRTRPGTLRLSIDAKGLRFECDAPATSYAVDLATSIRRGDIDGCSFRFYVAKNGDVWQRQPDGQIVRELLEVDIDDVSIVTYPAYRATEVSVRSLQDRDAFHATTAATSETSRSPALAHAMRRLRIADASR